jgi:two-component system cell cycle response regulator
MLSLPENCSPSVLAEVQGYLKGKFADAVDAGHNRALIDVHQLRTLHMGIIKLLVQTMQLCRELGIEFTLVGNAQIAAECKGFEDTRTWHFHESLADARAALTKTAAAPAPVLAGAG